MLNHVTFVFSFYQIIIYHKDFYPYQLQITQMMHTQSPTTMISSIPGCRIGHLTRTEYPSTKAKVKLQGITKPMIVTK
jgi:hypothetical protein